MTDRPTANLIAPPNEETIIYPYRRVWPAIGVEVGILFFITAIVAVGGTFIAIPQQQWFFVNLTLIGLPLALWAGISWGRENFAIQPRQRLLAVMLLSALIANGIGYPLLYDVLAVQTWLTRGETTEQIIIYIFGFGVVQEVLKYVALRQTVWLNHLRNRHDAVAYGAASAIGYATVFNVRLVIDSPPPPNVAAILIFSTLMHHMVGSFIVAYGLAETRLARPSPLLTLGTVSMASVVLGLVTVVSNNIANTRLGLGVSTPRDILQLVISMAMVFGISVAVAFLMQNAERSEAEAVAEI
ncbi:MAG: PrsW family glutamic-type intramembrane protease [Chloroflexota bacterium]